MDDPSLAKKKKKKLKKLKKPKKSKKEKKEKSEESEDSDLSFDSSEEGSDLDDDATDEEIAAAAKRKHQRRRDKLKEKERKHKEKKEKSMKKLEGKMAKLLAKLSTVAPDYPVSGAEAWARLAEGNKRFMSGEVAGFLAHIAQETDLATRRTLTSGQHPFATVITCADSRVSPELIFDEGLGQLFIIRVAGNVVDDSTLGSIEYGVVHLSTPLLLIMGHQNCGAVTAAMGADHGHGPISSILDKIAPAVAEAKATGKTDEAELLDCAVQANVRLVKKDCLAKSKACRELVAGGALSIMCAEYYLDSGEVKLVDK